MPYVIKRYANRKLYDTQSKRYLTLEEIAVLVRAGEEVQVVDADSGDDLTGQVLSKIILDGTRREGGLVPQNLLVEWIQRPGEAVVDAVKSSVSVGRSTVEQFAGELGKLFTGLAARGQRDAASARQAADGIARVIEGRLRTVIAELDLVSRSEVAALARRVAALEAAVDAKLEEEGSAPHPARRAARAAKSGGTRAAVEKSASRKARKTRGESHGEEKE